IRDGHVTGVQTCALPICAKVARLVGATPAGVVFTASATEANNLAIRGLAERASGRHVVTSAVEHISVLNACRHLAKHGWEIAYEIGRASCRERAWITVGA